VSRDFFPCPSHPDAFCSRTGVHLLTLRVVLTVIPQPAATMISNIHSCLGLITCRKALHLSWADTSLTVQPQHIRDLLRILLHGLLTNIINILLHSPDLMSPSS
jgi:hypothetical protein